MPHLVQELSLYVNRQIAAFLAAYLATADREAHMLKGLAASGDVMRLSDVAQQAELARTAGYCQEASAYSHITASAEFFENQTRLVP